MTCLSTTTKIDLPDWKRMNWFRQRGHHNFVIGEFSDNPGPWRRHFARCSRCGKERKVWWRVDMAKLNVGPCPDTASQFDELIDDARTKHRKALDGLAAYDAGENIASDE